MAVSVDPDAILDALDTTDDFVLIPTSVLTALGGRNGTRNAVVLCWLRFRSRGDWLAATLDELGAEIGLSADQTWRAMKELIDAGVVEWHEPDPMSRRRQYRVTSRQRGVDTASTRTPDAASTRTLPITKKKKKTTTASLPLGNGNGNEAKTHRDGEGFNARAARPADPLWDALVAVCGPAVTHPEQSRRGKCVKDLRAVGATASDVAARAATFRRLWPRITLTDTALVGRWSTLVPKVKASEW